MAFWKNLFCVKFTDFSSQPPENYWNILQNGFMLTPFCRKSFFLLFGQFSGIFWHFGESFFGNVPASKFCLVGGALFGTRPLQKMPHILFDIDDSEDDKDDDEHEDEDEFEDDKR